MSRRSMLQSTAGHAEPAGPTVLIDTSFAGGNFTAWQSCQWLGRNDDCQTYNGVADYSATVVSLDGRPHVGRFEVRNGDIPPFGGGERSEVAEWPSAEVLVGDEVWVALDIKFPTDFPATVSNWFILTQLHSSSDISPTVTLSVFPDDKIYLTNNAVESELDETEIGPIVRGKWVRYLLHFKAATSSATGWGEVYQDGVLVLPSHPRATMADGTDHYWKFGIYRNPTHTATNVVYMDNIKVSIRRP
jgi:polysaccharide lyase-like protein